MAKTSCSTAACLPIRTAPSQPIRGRSIVDGETEIALGTSTGPTLQVRLADGDNDIRLVITDNTGNQASDRVVITVSEGVTITTLSDIPNLTPNQRRVAQALDRICSDLRDLSGGEGQGLTNNQQDLLVRCDGLQTGNTTGNQVAALEELVADDFAVARTQTLLFANTQYASVMDRLMALRGGARGLSLAGSEHHRRWQAGAAGAAAGHSERPVGRRRERR